MNFLKKEQYSKDEKIKLLNHKIKNLKDDRISLK